MGVDSAESCLLQLRCTNCGQRWPADTVQTTCPSCGRVLFAEYDLERAQRAMTPEALVQRSWTLWRYAELLPVRNPVHRLTLGEGGTPLIPSMRFAEYLGLKHLWWKDEGQNPTGSFKARGQAAAISRARTWCSRCGFAFGRQCSSCYECLCCARWDACNCVHAC